MVVCLKNETWYLTQRCTWYSLIWPIFFKFQSFLSLQFWVVHRWQKLNSVYTDRILAKETSALLLKWGDTAVKLDPNRLIWTIHGPGSGMVWCDLWHCYGPYMELVWDMASHSFFLVRAVIYRHSTTMTKSDHLGEWSPGKEFLLTDVSINWKDCIFRLSLRGVHLQTLKMTLDLTMVTQINNYSQITTTALLKTSLSWTNWLHHN